MPKSVARHLSVVYKDSLPITYPPNSPQKYDGLERLLNLTNGNSQSLIGHRLEQWAGERSAVDRSL